MRKLTYYCAEHLTDSRAYNIRERTKRAAVKVWKENPGLYGPVFKMEIAYVDAFDLMEQCLTRSVSEGNL